MSPLLYVILPFRSTMVACYSSVYDLIKVRDMHLYVIPRQEKTTYFCGGIEERGRLEVLRMLLALLQVKGGR